MAPPSSSHAGDGDCTGAMVNGIGRTRDMLAFSPRQQVPSGDSRVQLKSPGRGLKSERCASGHSRSVGVRCMRGALGQRPGSGLGVRLHSNVVTSATCIVIIAAYAGWRTGLLRAAGRRLSAPLARAGRGLAQLASGCGIRLPLPGDAGHRATVLTAASGGCGISIRAVSPGYTLYTVPLPPRRPNEAQAPSVTTMAQPSDGAAVCTSSPTLRDVPASTVSVASASERRELLEVHLLDLQRLPAAALEAALAPLAADPGVGVLGLDAEWEPEVQPGVRHRISVIQIATEKHCWVLRPGPGGVPPHSSRAEQRGPHAGTDGSQPGREPCGGQAAATPGAEAGTLATTTATLPAAVVSLLGDPRVIKAGVGIQEDVRRLERDFGVRVRGAVDIRLVAQRVSPGCLAGGGSLRSLTEALLGRLLDKSAQRSHWGAESLDEQQVAYAAHDAWLSRELLLQLHRMHILGLSSSSPSPSPQGAAEPELPLQDAQPQSVPNPVQTPIQDFAAPFLDVFGDLKMKRVEKALGPAPHGHVSAGSAAARASPAGAAAAVGKGAEGGGGGGVGGNGAGGRLKDHKLPTRKSVLYENCRLLAPDGVVLCTCGAKKVRWYLERGLADVVSEHPTTIQLRFEPRGRGHADDEYYLADKENRCCVCGAGGEYLRHSVVPHCYRQHFPPSMKSHLSHDIVLMCPPCHKAGNMADQRRMAILGEQYGAPLGAATAAKFRHDSSLGAVRSAGRALSNPKVVIPPERRRELEAVVCAHFGLTPAELTAEHVAEAANVEPRSEDESWCSHAEVVVKALRGREALEAFVRGWRRHFLDTMRPRFMPPHWRVDARVANSAAPEGGEEGEQEEEEEGSGEENGAGEGKGECVQ